MWDKVQCEECPVSDTCTKYFDGFNCIKKERPNAVLIRHELTDSEFEAGVFPCQLCDFHHYKGCPAELCATYGWSNYFTVKFNDDEDFLFQSEAIF